MSDVLRSWARSAIALMTLLAAALAVSSATCQSEPVVIPDYLYVASWNLENFFDTVDDPDKHDQDFTPSGSKKWTSKRLDQKTTNLARVIDYMNGGQGPDLLGVQEVEHERLLLSVLAKSAVAKKYAVAYAESPDERGIDTALIYNDDLFDLADTQAVKVNLGNDRTRFILLATLTAGAGANWYVLVNHWPSRHNPDQIRVAAGKACKKAVAGIYKLEERPRIIIMGDFNDEPDDQSVRSALGAKDFKCGPAKTSAKKLYNLAYQSDQAGEGAYRYRGEWLTLDQIIVSGALVSKRNYSYECGSFEVVKPAFMTVKSGYFQGQPRPTHAGKKYLGGYSDHFPVGAKISR